MRWPVGNMERVKCQVLDKYTPLLKNTLIKKILSKEKSKSLSNSWVSMTREYLDPVRSISNESSGKQGFEIAEALSRLGIKTTLITGPSHLSSSKDIKTKKK